MELEKLKVTTKLREAEQEQEKYTLKRTREVFSGGSVDTFDLAYNLRLVPRFNEKGVCLKGSVTPVIGLIQRKHCCQCVLTGKAQEAMSAISLEFVDNLNYLR